MQLWSVSHLKTTEMFGWLQQTEVSEMNQERKMLRRNFFDVDRMGHGGINRKLESFAEKLD